MIQFSEKVNENILAGGYKIWPGEEFTGPKLLRPETYPAIQTTYANSISSVLCDQQLVFCGVIIARRSEVQQSVTSPILKLGTMQ